MTTTADTAPPKRSGSLAHDVVSALSQRILNGLLKPGDKLPSENDFVREFGVSRTVVREAISRLQASGLVETHHGKGTFVLANTARTGLRLGVKTAESVRNLLELRLGLESQAVALAALRRTDEQLQQMREALDDYQELASKGDSCVEADRRFHLLIAEATGNSYFTSILLQLGNEMIPRTRIAQEERGGTDFIPQAYVANVEHEAILQSIRRRDPDAARAAMWTHLNNSRLRLSNEGNEP